MTNNAAQSACHDLGGSLVNIDSEAENTLVGSLLPQTKGSWAWSGNKVGTSPEFFLDGRPNGEGDCIRFFSLVWTDKKDKWDDQPCSDSLTFLCSKKKSSGRRRDKHGFIIREGINKKNIFRTS